MFAIRKIEGETKQWVLKPDENVLENPRFGRVEVVMVTDPETGEEKYEAPIYTESQGEVNVVVNNEGKIAFVVQDRHVVIPLEYLNENWTNTPPKILEMPHGVRMTELPRGFSTGIMQEAEEETQFKVEPIAQIGNINVNSAVFGTSPIVRVGKATEISADIPPDPGEKILKVLWLTPEEITEAIADGDIFDGFSLGALMLFIAWAKIKQENPFLKNLAARF